MTQAISEIKYKNKTIDRGLILGTRKYHWCLKRQYEPLWAKNGAFCNKISPQKTNFTVYIPLKELRRDIEYTICDVKNYMKIKITKVTKAMVEFDLIESWQRPENNKTTKDQELIEMAGF